MKEPVEVKEESLKYGAMSFRALSQREDLSFSENIFKPRPGTASMLNRLEHIAKALLYETLLRRTMRPLGVSPRNRSESTVTIHQWPFLTFRCV